MNLPVQLAVALLQDRNGVIDLDLPIGGSIDDPQFSIGGLIVKVIVNLIVKAVTQPFALLGSLFGGGADLGHIAFAAGRATLDDKGQDVLGKLAKALTERPGLKLEISGRADPDSDRAGLVDLSIERKLRAQKLKTEGRSAGPGQAVSIGKEEYPQLLEQVYRAEKFDKPRNAVGLTKTVPVEEMEKLIRANTVISDDDLLALANRRVQAARDWLLESGQIAPERIFVVASRLAGAAAASSPAPVADGGESTGVQDEGAKDQPPRRVEFSLR
jgi:outer membrane protein OmpA-like peptidoglycan-associated protein